MLAVERVCLTTVTYLTVQAAKIPTRYLEHKKAFKEVILCIAHLMNVSQVIARLRHRVTTRANTVCSLARGNYYAKNIKLYEQETNRKSIGSNKCINDKSIYKKKLTSF